MYEITIYHYLFIALFLFVIGFAGAILCKNIIKVLISIEFILTGVNLNFVAFNSFCGTGADGFIITLFYTGIGAVELAVALYIFYLMFIKKQSEDIENYGEL